MVTHVAVDVVRAARKDLLISCLYDSTNPQPLNRACWLPPQVHNVHVVLLECRKQCKKCASRCLFNVYAPRKL